MSIFDPIALCLVRELCEADEALKTVSNALSGDTEDALLNWYFAYGELGERGQSRDDMSEALLAHLLLMPCPAIDTSAYERLWAESLALSEDERENGKLWDAVEDIARKAIALYRGMK